MSKSRGNVVNPDDIVKQYGADTLRLYELFLGPHEMTVTWNDKGITGTRRFLERIWKLSDRLEKREEHSDQDMQRILHQTIKKVSEDIESMKFNTAIAQMMNCLNVFEKKELIPQTIFEKLLIILAPFAPHIAEEMWQQLGHITSITQEQWPTWDEKMIVEDVVTMAVQVNGKMRGTIDISPTASEEEAKSAALKQESVQRHLEGKSIVKTIYVPGKILNIVVK